MKPTPAGLPIRITPELDFDLDAAGVLGESQAAAYRQATPFPHIAIDNFLPEDLIASICSHFPDEATNNEMLYERGYKGQHKRQINPNQCDPYLKKYFLRFQLCANVAISRKAHRHRRFDS